MSPVITRELRAEARRAWNYWLRVAGAGAMMAVCAVMVWGQPISAAQLGARLFGNLNCFLFVLIWILAPLLAADCISRERREGTLSLLFLTPLKGLGIVAAKGLIHGLRGLMLLLAAIPVMAIPLLVGGVTGLDLLTASAFDLAALFLGLAAGLLASACGRHWLRTILLGSLLSLALAWAFADTLVTAVHTGVVFTIRTGVVMYSYGMGRQGWLGEALTCCTGLDNLWSQNVPPGGRAAWLQLLGGALGFSLLLLVLVVLATARHLNRNWREDTPSRLQLWLLATFCTPRFWVSLFRRWQRRRLAQNPISWLQQYSWSARLTCWGWFLVVILFETYLLENDFNWWSSSFLRWQPYVAFLLFTGMAFSAATSFKRERDNGALELLLVSPLTVAQIVFGRVWGIWKQFLPAVSALLVGWTAMLGVVPYQYGGQTLGELRWLFVLIFPVIPLLGLYLSMRCKYYLTAWLGGVLLGIGLPFLLTFDPFDWVGLGLGYPSINGGIRSADLTPPYWLLGVTSEFAVGLLSWRRLLTSLRRREFALGIV